jgi:uncharacterized protein (DUF1778 family)
MHHGLGLSGFGTGKRWKSWSRLTHRKHTLIVLDNDRIEVYGLKVYKQGGLVMPRVAVDDNKRLNLRVTTVAKSKLVRAAALRHTGLTDFVTQTALREADAVIAAAEVVTLSERDSLFVLNLLEHPPAPNAKLRAAIAAMPKPVA